MATTIKVMWEEAYDEQGNVYYYNVETNETSWDPPEGKHSIISSIINKVKSVFVSNLFSNHALSRALLR